MAEKILIVDDDRDLRSELCDLLEGYEVVEASAAEAALELLRKPNEVGLVILDVWMPGLNGIEALTEIKKLDPGLGIIILTGHSSKDVAIEALKGHADDYIEKPVDMHKIKDAVERLLGKKSGQDSAGLGLEGKIEKVKTFVERNFCKKVTLKEAANAVCLSPKYLSRIFREFAKTGFGDYKLALKVNKAKEFLGKSAYNINQISDKLGYENTESFIRVFKKLTKCTPTQYRKKIKQKKHGKKR